MSVFYVPAVNLIGRGVINEIWKPREGIGLLKKL